MSDTQPFHTAQRDVPVPATRQPLFAVETLAIGAVIQADFLNTTRILIYDALTGGVSGVELEPGDTFPVNSMDVMDLMDLSKIYIDTITADDKVTITWRD
jgi:hypothetical protein